MKSPGNGAQAWEDDLESELWNPASLGGHLCEASNVLTVFRVYNLNRVMQLQVVKAEYRIDFSE